MPRALESEQLRVVVYLCTIVSQVSTAPLSLTPPFWHRENMQYCILQLPGTDFGINSFSWVQDDIEPNAYPKSHRIPENRYAGLIWFNSLIIGTKIRKHFPIIRWNSVPLCVFPHFLLHVVVEKNRKGIIKHWCMGFINITLRTIWKYENIMIIF